MTKIEFNFDPNKISFLRELEQQTDDKVVDILVDIFLEGTPISLEKMAKHLKSGEISEMAREAHKLKSGSGNLGLVSLSTIFATIETQARSNDGESCAFYLDQAVNHFQEAKTVLSKLR